MIQTRQAFEHENPKIVLGVRPQIHLLLPNVFSFTHFRIYGPEMTLRMIFVLPGQFLQTMPAPNSHLSQCTCSIIHPKEMVCV